MILHIICNILSSNCLAATLLKWKENLWVFIDSYNSQIKTSVTDCKINILKFHECNFSMHSTAEGSYCCAAAALVHILVLVPYFVGLICYTQYGLIRNGVCFSVLKHCLLVSWIFKNKTIYSFISSRPVSFQMFFWCLKVVQESQNKIFQLVVLSALIFLIWPPFRG